MIVGISTGALAATRAKVEAEGKKLVWLEGGGENLLPRAMDFGGGYAENVSSPSPLATALSSLCDEEDSL